MYTTSLSLTLDHSAPPSAELANWLVQTLFKPNIHIQLVSTHAKLKTVYDFTVISQIGEIFIKILQGIIVTLISLSTTSAFDKREGFLIYDDTFNRTFKIAGTAMDGVFLYGT